MFFICKNMKKLLILATLLTLSLCAMAQSKPKKVAVWDAKCIGTDDLLFEADVVQGSLEEAVDNMSGYVKYDRAMFDKVMKEHNFERSGAVNDNQIKEMGEYAGVDYIFVPSVSSKSGYINIVVRCIDIKTGESVTRQQLSSAEPPEIQKACVKIAERMLGGNSGSDRIYTQPRPGGGNFSSQQGASTITIRVGNVSFDMVKVEAGSFIMGCTGEQGGECYYDESPYHRVTISQDYYIGKFEVTQELYEAVMGVNPSNWKAFDRPVERVSWNDAMEFCAELSRMTGRRFTLPTEAEWEYAARGGRKSTNAKYSGSASVSNVAWYDGNSGNQTHPVGKLRPNELGIYDMSGNVFEWCLDWYGSYSSASQTDPMGPGSGSSRVLRGGGWGYGARYCRVSNRNGSAPGYRYGYNGFRVVLH